MKFNKSINKKSPEELREYLAFQRRASRVEAKKGKGSYNRKAFKDATKERDWVPLLFFLKKVLTFSIVYAII